MAVGGLLRATEAAVRRPAAVVVGPPIAVAAAVARTAAVRMAVDMGGKTTMDSAPA